MCKQRKAETVITLFISSVAEHELFSITVQVCELVKFMIEHCQQILGEDPSSLFGGPPQRLDSEETGTETMET